MTNEAAAAALEDYADLLELKGESIHRLNAYRRAAGSVRESATGLAELHAARRLRSLPGVGPAIEGKLAELVERGSFHQLDELREELPASLHDLLEIPAIGPKTAMRLHRELGISDVAALETAARAGRLRDLAGFGERAEERILEGIGHLRERSDRLLLSEALPLAEALLAALRRQCPQIERADVGGSLRRMQETIGDIDLLCATRDPTPVIEAFAALPEVRRVLWRGEAKCSVLTAAGLQVDLFVLAPDEYGSLLQHFTGDKPHNIRLRTLALEQGLSLSEHGFERDGRVEPCAEEEEVYARLGLDWMPPELRTDHGELEAAAAHRLPRLVTLEEIRGDLHCHSTWSDGTASIEEMARAALARGYAYLAITDHSAGLGVANGLDAERLRQQREEIEAIQERLPEIRLLHGIELEIRADGSLDLDDDTLAWLDIVVASLHTSLRQPAETITERLLRAIRHPLVDIIGHPTGRILNRRPGAALEMDAIFEAASVSGTVLEVNADPARLDLADYQVRAALAAGVTISIDSDAHAPGGLDNLRYGLAQARRGWATASVVANSRPLPELLAGLKRRRAGLTVRSSLRA